MARKRTSKVQATKPKLISTRLELPPELTARLEEGARRRVTSRAAYARWLVIKGLEADERREGKS
jgi:hypothetical protein